MRIPRLILLSTLVLAVSPAAAEPNKQILERAQHYQADALKLLERLVNIDSGTGYEEGLKQIGANPRRATTSLLR